MKWYLQTFTVPRKDGGRIAECILKPLQGNVTVIRPDEPAALRIRGIGRRKRAQLKSGRTRV